MEARDGMGADGRYHGITEVPGFELDHESAELNGAVLLPVQTFSEGQSVFVPVLYLNDKLGHAGVLTAPDGSRQVFKYAHQDAVSGMHAYHLVREEAGRREE